MSIYRVYIYVIALLLSYGIFACCFPQAVPYFVYNYIVDTLAVWVVFGGPVLYVVALGAQRVGLRMHM